MADKNKNPGSGAAPKMRADALRNREKLLEVAKAAFSEVGPEVSLDEIARRAGVGIGTLYRHFPNRGDLVAAVYHRDVRQLADAADKFLATMAAGDALHEWLRLSVHYVASKWVIAAALNSAGGDMTALKAQSGNLISDSMARLVQEAVACGDIRADVETDDLLRALTGLAHVSNMPGWEASTLKLIDILMAGLRADAKPA